jgi:2-dehydro-3-deoxyphosphogluconate aldolase / (4S)-4-hydroxy-2-oxoglutarate aldolase
MRDVDGRTKDAGGRMKDADELMRFAPVIPVLVIDDASYALPIAEALVSGGLRVLEVTLRTPAALEVIRAMSKVRGAIVGAGTVLNERDLGRSLDAGAKFVVSPGLTESLARTARASGVPFLPGVATASDIMRGLDLGLNRFKFFPATALGGIPTLKALAAPFPMCRFCPTGGISQATAPDWLALDYVACVGGSWLVARGAPDPVKIKSLAGQASALSLNSVKKSPSHAETI